ncbi:MAG: SUMF1/EgtB/PvdO family nonheme iron enzyme [Planctomycetota bacterium]
MQIVVGCKECGHIFKVKDIFEGIEVECPNCNKKVRITKLADQDDTGLPTFDPKLDEILNTIFTDKEKQAEEEAKKVEITPPKKPILKTLKPLFITGFIILFGIVAAMLYKSTVSSNRYETSAKKLFENAQNAFDNKQFDKSLASCNKILKEFPKSSIIKNIQELLAKSERELEAAALLSNSIAFEEAGNFQEALKSIEKLLVRYFDTAAAENINNKAEELNVKIREQEIEQKFNQAKTLLEQGNLEEAKVILDEIALTKSKLASEASKISKELEISLFTVKELLIKAVQARGQCDFETARRILNEIIVKHKNSAAALKAKEELEKTEQAYTDYMENNFNRYFSEGEKALSEQEWKRAREAFSTALSFRPNNSETIEKQNYAQKMEDLYHDMILIPAGEFIMGANQDCEEDESPKHKVQMKAYYISKYPVTNVQYKKFIDANPDYPVPYIEDKKAQPYCWDKETRTFPQNKENYPVVLVSWKDAMNYCKWIGKTLPTEAQWEKAARGTDGRKYPWGDKEPNPKLANFANNVGDITAVDRYPDSASPFGIMDCAGNVLEWCFDYYDKRFYNNPAHSNNPCNLEKSEEKVLRGASFGIAGQYIRCSNRYSEYPDNKSLAVGFRCVLDVKE